MIRHIKRGWTKVSGWGGIQTGPPSNELVISGVGGVISLMAISAVSLAVLGTQGALAVVPSMGAATVLLFAFPHAPLSQPWALFVGNLLPAIIGVSCSKYIPNDILASGLAVGLAVSVMGLCRCLHPPGGATALAAVIGGPAIENLGYAYVLTPVLINCSIIFLTAMFFNGLFPWRRYPLPFMRFKPVTNVDSSERLLPDIAHFDKAIAQYSNVLDITAYQARELYQQAEKIRLNELSENFDFQLGGMYSNNKPGAQWAVRQIIDYATHPNPEKTLVIYKVVEGAKKNSTDSCSRSEFAQWSNLRLKSIREN